MVMIMPYMTLASNLVYADDDLLCERVENFETIVKNEKYTMHI